MISSNECVFQHFSIFKQQAAKIYVERALREPETRKEGISRNKASPLDQFHVSNFVEKPIDTFRIPLHRSEDNILVSLISLWFSDAESA